MLTFKPGILCFYRSSDKMTQYNTVLLLQTVLILQGSNGLWSSGSRQQFSRYLQPQQDCCKTDNYIGLVPPTPPSYDRYRYEGFQNYPRVYQEGYHNKHNQYDYNRRYLPTKHSSYSKDYYRKGQSHTPYMQRRAGFGFVDDHYVKRPYNKAENGFNFRNSQINYRPYYEKDYGNNDREIQSDKYSPGLLLSSVADRPGTIIVTDPDGIKHRINSFSLKEFELPESNKPFYLAPGNNDPIKDAIDVSKPSHDFTDELKIPSPKDPFKKNGYKYPNRKTSVTEGHYNDSFFANPQNNRYISSSAIRFPSDVNDFHPSPPFHKYSEPDPLFHPNGSPLQTHSPQLITSPPTTSTAFPTPRRHPTYPDSINAQLPDNNGNINVPYVRDEVYDTKSTSATQATEATQKKLSLTQIAPTKPSSFSTPGNDMVSSSTQRSTREDQKKWDFLPTVQQASSSPIPQEMNGFSSSSTFSTESPTQSSTSTVTSTATPESKILPSISNLDNNPVVSYPTAATKLDFSETVKSNNELQQEPTTETQLYVNTTVTQTTAASIDLEIQTDAYSTASVFVPDTNALEDTENVTTLEDFYFNSMSNATLYEETATTVMPDVAHTY